MSTMIVFRQMLVILILIALGYVLYRMGKISDDGSRTMSFLVVNITNPAVVLTSAFQEDNSLSHQDLLLGLLVCAVIYVILIILGKLLPVLMGTRKDQRRFYTMLCVYSNVGFMGIPLVSAILGSEAVLYVTLMVILFNIFFYTHGYATILSGVENASYKVSWKSFINVGTVSGVIAIVACWFRLRPPEVIVETVGYAGKATTFLAMVVLGAALAKTAGSSILNNKRVIIFWGLRYMGFPLLAGLLLKAVLGSTLLSTTLCFLMAMPAASMPLMLADQYGQDTEILSSETFLTTVLCIIPVTLMTLIV